MGGSQSAVPGERLRIVSPAPRWRLVPLSNASGAWRVAGILAVVGSFALPVSIGFGITVWIRPGSPV